MLNVYKISHVFLTRSTFDSIVEIGTVIDAQQLKLVSICVGARGAGKYKFSKIPNIIY